MNFPATGVQDVLQGVFARRGRTPEGMVFSWAELSDGRFLAGIALLRDEPVKARSTLDYRQVRLREEWLQLNDGIERLTALLTSAPSGAAPTADKFETELWGDRNQLIEHHENFSRWPEWVFTARLARSDSTVQCPSGAAVGHGMRPFDSFDRAVEWWVCGEGPKHNSGGQARHIRELLLVVPDTRGMLANARWEGNRITGTIHTEGSHDELELQVVLETDTGPVMLAPMRPVPPDFISDVPKNSRRADVYLVHAIGDLMGSSRLTPGSEVSAEVRSLSVLSRAERDLARGENDRVEFKPFIGGKDNKDAEVLASVVAFANTYGGAVYLGVGNDGEPEGEAALSRVLKGSGPDYEEKYRKQVDALVRERLKPVPMFTVEFVEIGNQRVLVISVDEGMEKPYCTKDGNHVFIRKGASNMRPDPKTEMPQSRGGVVLGSGGLLGGRGWIP